jgi:RNA polymerase sigma-70 factor, ECF subfamily
VTDARSEDEGASELLSRIRAGESEAEAELFTRYYPRVLAAARRASRSHDVAEDAAQETFRIALLRLRGRGLDREESLGAFLSAIAIRLITAHYRKMARQRTMSGEPELLDLEAPSEDALARLIRSRELSRVLEVLARMRNERDREILDRVYIREEPREVVRRDLGLDELHFNRVLHRARGRFRDLFMKG